MLLLEKFDPLEMKSKGRGYPCLTIYILVSCLKQLSTYNIEPNPKAFVLLILLNDSSSIVRNS